MDYSNPYKKLVALAQHSRQHACPLPAEETVVDTWSGVGFTLCGRHYVSPMGEVAEILPIPKYTQVPGVLSWVKGVANVRGRLLPVMDLPGFLNHQHMPSTQARRKRLIVVEKGELYSGLIVDEVLGMQHFQAEDLTAEYEDQTDPIYPYVTGAYRQQQMVWALFSPHMLAADPRFMQVAC